MKNESNNAMVPTPVNVVIPTYARHVLFASVAHLGRWAK